MLFACLSALFGAPVGVLAFAAAVLCLSLYELSQERALMAALARIELRWGAGLSVKDPEHLLAVYEQALDMEEGAPLSERARRAPCRRGAPQVVALTLQNPSAAGVLLITPLSSEGAHERLQLFLETGAEVTLAIPFRLERAGTLKLWGLELDLISPLGTRRISRFVQLPQRLSFSPRLYPEARAFIPEELVALSSGRAARGQSIGRQKGEEGEFEELRAYQPGDPQRRIAWRPSARRASLLVRVYQQPLELRPSVCLDIGAPLREGPAGERPIDLALDLASSLIELSPSLPWGLYGFDHRLISRFPPSDAQPKQLLRRRILSLLSPHMDGAYSLDETQLIALCGATLRAQRRLREGGWDPKLALQYQGLIDPLRESEAEDELRALLDRGRGERRESSSKQLLRFFEQEGLTLPYRAPVSDWSRERGLAEALRAAHRDGSTHLFVITKGEGLSARGLALSALQELRKRGSRLSWLQLGALDDEQLRRSVSRLAQLHHFEG